MPSNPHSLRKTLAGLGQQICTTPEEIKAWSQNLGHDHVLTTFTSYGTVASTRQAEILAGLAARNHATKAPADKAQLDRIESLLARLAQPNQQPA